MESAESRTVVAPRMPQALATGKKASGYLAFERLLVTRQHQVGGLAVGRERRIDAPHLKRRAIEMRRFARAVERNGDPAKVLRGRHCARANQRE